MITYKKLSQFEQGLFKLETRKTKLEKLRKELGKVGKFTAAAIDVYDEGFVWFTDSSNPHELDSIYTIYWAWR